jgi:magnesium-transporting ATPase (P-type)
MDISGLLKHIVINIKARDHASVLDEMARGLITSPGGPAGVKAICDLRDHESLNGVLSGTGGAVFHCLSEAVSETAVALATSRRGIPHPAKKEPVRIFFLIISPMKESGTHLQLLSQIEGLLMDASFRKDVLEAKGEAEATAALRKAAGAARAAYMPLERDEVFKELGTSERGLTEAEARERLRIAGPNEIKRIRRGGLAIDFLHNLFLNLFAVLLWAGGAMAFVGGMPELGWAIFLVIIINAVFSFWQEYKAERAVEALGRLLPRKVTAIRDGAEKEVDASLLVPGDLIRLSEGDGVPADGRLVEADQMRVDNSTLTGESRPVYKVSEPLMDGRGFIWTEVPNLVFAGTVVLSGAGSAVVTATGMDTEIGRVAYMTQAIRPEESPLQKELRRITKTVTALAVVLGLVFFFLGFSIAGLTFAESFIFAIGIIVANVPEGLLPTVSLSLAMGVQRMAKRNAIVKKLSAVETLGSATVICTDKTGTLTANRMCVTRLFVGGAVVEVSGDGYEPSGGFASGGSGLSRDDLSALGALRLLTGAALCNNARLKAPSEQGGAWAINGDPTEGALLTAAAKAGLDLDALSLEHPRTAHLPFERIRKRMTTVHARRGGAAPGKALAFVKGAPREVIELCASAVIAGGGAQALTEELRAEILVQNDAMASMGLRVLAVAEREIERGPGYVATEVERDLTFLGLVAMLDPPRPEVKGAIEECRGAGLRVVMVTGDYGLTAKAIAREVGLGAGLRAVEGPELSRLTHRELRDILKRGSDGVLFARVEPKDKLRVVTALQDNGEVVAVTGDGVNDAPALKKADIGVAMGLRGSDAAKESAEIILADDNFASIVEAVREGRAVYANIKKFVTYIFASNIPEIVPFIAFVMLKIPLPLTVMQILAVDLGTDVLPALGLGVEPPEPGVMKEPPRPRTKRLLDLKTLTRAYLFLGGVEAALSMAAFFAAYWLRGWTPGAPMEATGEVYAVATTMSFAGIVASQAGNVFACRTERASVFSAGFFKNRFVLFALAAEAALAAALIYTPFLGRVFGFAPLTLKDLAFLASFPAVLLAAEEVRKALMRRASRA